MKSAVSALFTRLKVQPRWRVSIFLTVAAALNYADRSALSSVLPALKKELVLSDTQLGLIGSVFLWSYALASPVAGSLADRYSRRRLALTSLLLWSLVTTLTGVVGGLVSLLVLRVALGLSESLFLPAAIGLSADHHGTATRAKAISLVLIGINAGVVLGGTGAGFLADHFGWRTGFWTLGLVGMAFGLIFQPLLMDGPAASTGKAAAPASVIEAVSYLARTPSYYVLLIKATLAGIAIWIFLSWAPLYFQEGFGLSLGAAGFVGTVMLQGASVFGTMLGGWISDAAALRQTRRRMLVHGHCYLAAAPFLLIFLLHPNFMAAVVAVTAFSLFRGMGGASEQPILCDVTPARYRSTAVGIMNMSSSAVGGAGVLLTGMLKSSLGLNGVFAMLSGVFLIAAGSLYLGYRYWVAQDIARAASFDLSPTPEAA